MTYGIAEIRHLPQNFIPFDKNLQSNRASETMHVSNKLRWTCMEDIWIFIQVKNEYSRERRPLVDFLAKIECFARANSAWSASLQNEYRKLYVCTSMSAHMLAEYQPTD